MADFWCSFYLPHSLYPRFEYHGPWWVSGESEDEAIIVAAVRADDEASAMERLRVALDEEVRPDALKERFCEKKSWDGFPYTDRFPQADWMKWPQPQASS